MSITKYILAFIFILACGYGLYSMGNRSGYEVGHDEGYEKGHNEGYNEGFDDGYAKARKKFTNPKGDGEDWYAESISNGNYYLYHSTTNCPNIKKGIQKNWGFTNDNYRKQHSLFCSKCMDDALITKCENYLYSNNDWH